jgi:hypothetical protein
MMPHLPGDDHDEKGEDVNAEILAAVNGTPWPLTLLQVEAANDDQVCEELVGGLVRDRHPASRSAGGLPAGRRNGRARQDPGGNGPMA